MDFYRNVSVSGDFHQQEQLLASASPCSKLGTAALTPATSPLDDLFSAQNTEVDVSLEWLSVFVEDCLTSTGNCLPAPTTDVFQQTNIPAQENPPPSPKPLQQKPQVVDPSSLKKLVIPGKARSKRRKTCINPLNSWYCYAHQQQPLDFTSSDPPMLQQTYWLADSELIMPKKEEDSIHKGRDNRQVVLKDETGMEMEGKVKENLGNLENNIGAQQPRRCTHCLSQRTPQWRAGPLGPKTLCNACGVRYKSGRLLPEYRPAKSPTFVSYLHSNSHKKVLEMRMASSVVFNS